LGDSVTVYSSATTQKYIILDDGATTLQLFRTHRTGTKANILKLSKMAAIVLVKLPPKKAFHE
jgi:hypothetical protein